jgi:hypothetical protein
MDRIRAHRGAHVRDIDGDPRRLETHARQVAARTSSKLDDLIVALIGHTQGFVLFILALYAGSLALSLTRNEVRIVGMAVALAILVQIGLWGNLITGYAIEHALHNPAKDDGRLGTGEPEAAFILRL